MYSRKGAIALVLIAQACEGSFVQIGHASAVAEVLANESAFACVQLHVFDLVHNIIASMLALDKVCLQRVNNGIEVLEVARFIDQQKHVV